MQAAYRNHAGDSTGNQLESLGLFQTTGAAPMVDVPLRHKNRRKPAATPPAEAGTAAKPVARAPEGLLLRHSGWFRPLAIIAATITLLIAIGGLFQTAIDAYRTRLTVTGLTDDPTPVDLAIGAESLAIPANMLRSAKARLGGPVESAALVLHWPMLEGYSDASADAFKDGAPSAPIIYATIATRDTPLDSTGRLDDVYARFFVGKPVAAPAGLVGRQLSPDSGYQGEIIYFAPSEPRPFVARCLAEATAEIPATCMRDVNFGRGLSLLYRFNRDRLEDWRELDAGMQKLAGSFLRR
jgi:hypothetical protein